jgi:hypothetical protein
MGRILRSCVFTVLALTCYHALAFFGQLDFASSPDEEFSDEAVIRGMKASEPECRKTSGAVWATVGAEGECLRYWYAGFKDAKVDAALFYFTGDLLEGGTVRDKAYSRLTPAKMQASVDAVASASGVPYVLLARPGTYGSSGEHRERRRVLESQLVSAAIDEIKRIHRIERINIAGQSGGGHVVASLLGFRADIRCAVAASAVSAPKARWIAKGLARDTTGYGDSYEPVEHLDRIVSAGLRVFVVGDPHDMNVPFATQVILADRLKTRGVDVQIIQAEGGGSENHVLARSSILIGTMCMKGATTEQILDRAARGLKG